MRSDKEYRHPYHCDPDGCRGVCLVRCLLHSPPVPKQEDPHYDR